MPAREKEATRSVIYFSRGINEQTACEAGGEARWCGFASMESAGEKKLTRKGSNDDIY